MRIENSHMANSGDVNSPQLIIDPTQAAGAVLRGGGPMGGQVYHAGRQAVGVHSVTTKFSSMSDPISPIGIVSRQTTDIGLDPTGSVPHDGTPNHMNQPANLPNSANNPTRAMINFLNNGQAVVASHALSSQPAQEATAPVNKTISDSNQIRIQAVKTGNDIKLAPNERKVGQYILGKSIGEGTFGKVKLGRHITTNEKVSYSSHFSRILNLFEFLFIRSLSKFLKSLKSSMWLTQSVFHAKFIF